MNVIDVVAVNWNAGSQLAEAVSSIEKYHHNLVSSVVIVDNASTDDSLERVDILQNLPFKPLIWARNMPKATTCCSSIPMPPSTVVVLMQAQSSRPVKTFTIGFRELGYNEAEHAKAMAVIPRLPALYDEPFADSSQIPTYLVSQLARQHVKVSLSGDAGDELFAGYNRYQITASLWRKLARVPAPLRAALARSITFLSPTAWDRLSGLIPGAAKHATFGDKLHKGAGVLASGTVDELYLGLVSVWHSAARLVAWAAAGLGRRVVGRSALGEGGVFSTRCRFGKYGQSI